MESAADFARWCLDPLVALGLFTPGMVFLRQNRDRVVRRRDRWLVLVLPGWVLTATLAYPLHRIFGYLAPWYEVVFLFPIVMAAVDPDRNQRSSARIHGPVGPAQRAFSPPGRALAAPPQLSNREPTVGAPGPASRAFERASSER